MKRVSFKIAKALKEAGYPQDNCDIWCQVPPKYQDIDRKVAQPTYLDVWLWLWREKGIYIDIESSLAGNSSYFIWLEKEIKPVNINEIQNGSPEEAIIAAIEYLVNHNLIK